MADYVGMKYSREWYEEAALYSLQKSEAMKYTESEKSILVQQALVYATLATIAPTMEHRSDNG